MRALHTDRAPAAIGPYSQAVAAGPFLFTAGQIGLVPETGQLATADVVGQAEQVFRNLAAVLTEAGLDFGDVVKSTVFLTDMTEFPAVNEVYARHFTMPYPARSTVAVAALPADARVEIEVVAKLH
jgi:2-iminobutanoate/2-iminopropanoate deaminase